MKNEKKLNRVVVIQQHLLCLSWCTKQVFKLRLRVQLHLALDKFWFMNHESVITNVSHTLILFHYKCESTFFLCLYLEITKTVSDFIYIFFHNIIKSIMLHEEF